MPSREPRRWIPRPSSATPRRWAPRLIGGLLERGRKVITPEAPAERAGNVCFLEDDGAALASRLAARGVLVWGGDGRIRVSAHLYNDAADVAAFFAAIDAVA